MRVNNDIMETAQQLMEYLIETMCKTEDAERLEDAREKAIRCVETLYEMQREALGMEDPCNMFLNKVLGWE